MKKNWLLTTLLFWWFLFAWCTTTNEEIVVEGNCDNLVNCEVITDDSEEIDTEVSYQSISVSISGLISDS